MSTDFSPQVRTKGEEYVVRGKVERVADSVWKVRGSAARPYIVNSDLKVDDDGGLSWEFVTCTCPHGSNVTLPQCSHWCAVLLTEVLRSRDMLDRVVQTTD